MPWTTLIDAATLAAHRRDPAISLVDCRFQLGDPDWGERDYRRAHIPGAVYAHLDRDLSGTKSGTNGRHPLPTVAGLRATFGRLGIDATRQVVAYDQGNGMFASRLWWLLRWMGHDAVAVLDGGLAAWTAQGGELRDGTEAAVPRDFAGEPDDAMVAPLAEVVASVAAGGPHRLVDARAGERFRGEVEPLDRRAGHIPGAVNHFFGSNVDGDGRFLPAEALRLRWEATLAGTPPPQVIAYCGSGVTACHNLLALERAGLTGARLYPGSWSEWSADPGRPIATGEGR